MGTLALRFYPKRPGFLRRTALWGTWCVGGCITSHYDARLRQLAHDAEESGKLGRFWTVVAAVTFNPELQDNIAALPRKLIARHGHSFEEARPLLKSLEEKYYNIPPQSTQQICTLGGCALTASVSSERTLTQIDLLMAGF